MNSSRLLRLLDHYQIAMNVLNEADARQAVMAEPGRSVNILKAVIQRKKNSRWHMALGMELGPAVSGGFHTGTGGDFESGMGGGFHTGIGGRIGP